jgi:hypothetical protein
MVREIKWFLSIVMILGLVGASTAQWVGEYDGAYRAEIFYNDKLSETVERGVKGNTAFKELYDENEKAVACVIEFFDDHGRDLGFYRYDYENNERDELEFYEKVFNDEQRIVESYTTKIKLEVEEGQNPVKLIKKAYKKRKIKAFLNSQQVLSRELTSTNAMDAFGKIDYLAKNTFSGFSLAMFDSVNYEFDADSNIVMEYDFMRGELFWIFKYAYNDQGLLKSRIRFDENWEKQSAINYAYDEHGNQVIIEQSPASESHVDEDNVVHSREVEYSRVEIDYVWNDYRQIFLWASRKRYLGNRIVADAVYDYDKRGTLISYKGYSSGFPYSETSCKIKYLD